jgi:medium-chain acyl-[acyl-carrier-protein] hydrolase
MPTTRAFDAWVTCPSPKPQARLRLFCFPYAGGSASLFRTWADDLPPEVEVCPIQLPGRESRFREPCYTRLLPLVQTLGEVLWPYLTLPFAFLGHSMGALISFELTRYLRRRAGPLPAHLFVSAHRAPQLPDRQPPIHDLPDAVFLEELRRLNGISSEVLENAELMELLFPLLRADFAVAETYEYQEDSPLPCPISAFGGLEDEEVNQDEVAAWREQTRTTFTSHMTPGDHFFLFKHRATLLPLIAQELVQILSRKAI